MEDLRAPERDLSTTELFKHAVAEAKLLARVEIEHARLELKAELRRAMKAGILLGAGVVLALCGLTLLFVALALALPMSAALGALLVGVLLLAVAGLLAFSGQKRLPKKPMQRTKERLMADVTLTRERFA